MSTRKVILGLAVGLLLGVFTQPLLSQGTGSGGFSGGSGSMRSPSMRPPRMPGQPDFERMNAMSPEEKISYFQELAEEQRKAMEEQEALAMQQALNADDQQWKAIEPKLKKVRNYKDQAAISIGLPFQSSGFSSSFTSPSGQGGGQAFGGFAGGGFQFQAGGSAQGMTTHSSSPRENLNRPMTDGERICEELQRLLEDPGARPDQITLKLDALRKVREKAKKQLVKAQQELREVLNFRQQARLVLMGFLD